MSYSYTAYDRSGKEVCGTIDAASEHEALEEIRRKGLFPTHVGRQKESLQRGPKSRAPRGALRSLVFTLRQLAVLSSTGTPIVDALIAVERQTSDGAWRAILADVRRRVEEGATLAEAMGSHPEAFNAVCRSLVAAGETAGNLGVMLERLARLIRRQQRVRSAMVGALVYPALLISVSAGVLVVMIALVMPRFAEMFESLDAPLPASTEILMDLSAWLRAYWWAVLGTLIAGACGLGAWLSTAHGRATRDRILLRLPIVGTMLRSMSAGRIARLLSVLLASRIPLVEALELTRNTITNREYRILLEGSIERVTRGDSLSSVFSGSPLIPPSMTEALRSAERSGTVDTVLGDLADFIEEDNEALVRALTSVFEPIILIVLGVLVAFVAISIFLPLFDLTASATTGGA